MFYLISQKSTLEDLCKSDMSKDLSEKLGKVNLNQDVISPADASLFLFHQWFQYEHCYYYLCIRNLQYSMILKW